MTIRSKPLASRNNKLKEAISEVQKTNEQAKLTVILPKTIRSEFKIKAEQSGTTMSNLIQQYVLTYLRK